ncbi:MAG: Na(+)/H(+) antiporter subunit F [Acidimicrobiales bacterium]|nr:Na(+)/H(+) antiporter subunit F [Acidimicrobiales bacterium]
MIVAALFLTALGGAGFLYRIVRGPSLADRVVALDGLVVAIVAATILNSIRIESRWFVGVAVVVALIGFLGTSASARFIEQRGG